MNNMSKHLDLSGNVASLNSPEIWINFQTEAGYQADSTLRLVSLDPFSVRDCNLKEMKRKWKGIDVGTVSGRDSLVLGLQRSRSPSEITKWSSSRAVSIVSSAYVADEECSMNLDLSSQLELDIENVNIPKASAVSTSDTQASKPAIDLDLNLSVGPAISDITSEDGTSAQSMANFPELVLADGSVAPSRIHGSNLIPYMREVPKSPVDRISRNIIKQNCSSNTKKCQFPQCWKGARGASGRCISHGGGQRCRKADCQKGAEGKTIYCKLHGGGRRCEKLGCLKSAEGSTNLCIAHGGGRRCSQVDCTSASRGKSGLCIKHGGGRRCKEENCTKSAEGRSGLCIAHGGGKRCHYKECTKGAQGSTMFCKAHGGGKRCSFEDCNKGAEGSTPFCKRHGGGKHCLFKGGGICSKSVRGGTQFCVSHGGGKRCANPECTKGARGRTDYCVRHGGGKRCQFEGCGKSAQGRTNFCKAHGGSERCSWDGQAGSNLGSDGPPCNRFSTGKGSLCAAHSGLVQDSRVHGGIILGTPTLQKPSAQNQRIDPIIPVNPEVVSPPEGRVHGGNLMALLAMGAPLNQSESLAEECSTSNQYSSHTMNYGSM